MIIPWEQIDRVTLYNLIESFVLREGTDYGAQEQSLQKKVADVYRQIQSGKVVIVWSVLHKSINIIPRTQFPSN